MADTNEAPGALRRVQDFVNTVDLEGGFERFADPASMAAWMAEFGYSEVGRASEADVALVRATREALRSLMGSNSGHGDATEAVEHLNAIARRVNLTVVLERPDSMVLKAKGEGIHGFLGGLLVIVYDAMSDGSWARLKACAKDSCRWAFYDHARNRSGKWCSMSVCGNRVKAQTYRRRQTEPTEA